MDDAKMTALKDAFMSMTPDEEDVLRQMLQQREMQAKAQAIAAQLPDRGPTYTYLTRQKYCPETGKPLIGLQVLCPDNSVSQEFMLEVPTAEGLAKHLNGYASEFRQRYPANWFDDEATTPAVETGDAVPENS